MIRSKTTTERLLRTGVLTILVVGYSAWSLWDGYIAYPRANVESALRNKIGMAVPRPIPAPHTDLTEEQASNVQRGSTLNELTARLGRPHVREGKRAYYFGYGGYVVLELDAATITAVGWVDGPQHSATELNYQKTIGFVLLPLGLLLIAQFGRAARTRAVLDERGLWVRGKPFIPFEAMTGLNADRKRRAGTFQLHYELGGRPARLLLDDYVLDETPALVRAICNKKGFAQPASEASQGP